MCVLCVWVDHISSMHRCILVDLCVSAGGCFQCVFMCVFLQLSRLYFIRDIMTYLTVLYVHLDLHLCAHILVYLDVSRPYIWGSSGALSSYDTHWSSVYVCACISVYVCKCSGSPHGAPGAAYIKHCACRYNSRGLLLIRCLCVLTHWYISSQQHGSLSLHACWANKPDLCTTPTTTPWSDSYYTWLWRTISWGTF